MTPPPATTSPPCPECGGALQPVALGPDTAPWLCQRDSRGWWQAELDAAALYDHKVRDFGRATTAVLDGVRNESGLASIRGTSARPDMLPLLSDDVLASVAGNPRVAAGFQGQVRAEQVRRKGKA